MPQKIYIEPSSQKNAKNTQQLSSEESLVDSIRSEVLAIDGVKKLYPRASVAGHMLRAVSSVSSAQVREIFSQDDSENESEDKTSKNQHKDERIYFLRLGTTKSVQVPETVREVSRVVRKLAGQEAIIAIDVVDS